MDLATHPNMTVFPSPLINISYFDACSLGSGGIYLIGLAGNPVSAAWPAANRAILIPVTIPEKLSLKNAWVFNGAAVNGNFDIGIYNEDGVRLTSIGSTAQAGVNQIQSVAHTYVLPPGLYYWALAFDNNAGTTFRGRYAAPQNAFMLGMAQMAAAFPLPANFVFASITSDYIPVFGWSTRSVV